MLVSEDVLEKGCALFGATSARPLGGSEAALYEVVVDGRRHMLRFSPLPPDGEARFAAKWEFVDLVAQSGVRVAAPVLSTNGSKYELIVNAVDGARWAVVCVNWIDGRTLDPGRLAETDTAVLQAWGATMGSMHAIVKGRPRDPRLGDWREETGWARNGCEDARVRAAWDRTIARLESMGDDAASYGLVHNDLHYANILVDHSQITVVDFDVCAYHWFASDIAIAMQAVLWTEPAGIASDPAKWRYVYRQFMTGYSRRNELRPESEEAVPFFLSYRRLLLFSVFSHEWHDPSPWQRGRLDAWHRGIVDDVPIVPGI